MIYLTTIYSDKPECYIIPRQGGGTYGRKNIMG